MKTNYDDKQLIQKLKQLPQIEDQTDKDELFQRISSKMNNRKQRNHYSYTFWPVFSTAVVTLFILIIVPILMNLNMSETSVNDNSGNSGNVVNESSQNLEMAIEQRDMVENVQLFDSQIESYVIQNIEDDSTIIYGAVSDNQLQTVIPLTIVIPEHADLTYEYNQLEQYLDETDWGVNQYVLNEVSFDIDLDNYEVGIQIQDHFSIGEGSASPSMFERILTTMFTPYQIQKVVFNDKIDLGSIGHVSELPLLKPEKEHYNVFQADENRRKFLVPMKTEENYTIEEAFEDMKKGEETFHIYPTIPEDVDISLEMSDRELIISLNNDHIFDDEQKATIMIEAILMTAKSFGYEFVSFNGTTVDQVGPYWLSESIAVPEAINPIYR